MKETQKQQKQSVKVVARTFEVGDNNTSLGTNAVANAPATAMNNDLTLLAGKAAGICYMPDDYMEKGIQDEQRAFARAKQTSESGHHSVYDHGHITFVIKTNKMMAMILNSLGVYATSEKSARYTKMEPETELEMQLYDKWRVKIKDLILNKYPDIDDDMLSAKLCKQMGVEKSSIVNEGKVTLKEDDWLEEELFKIKKEFGDTLPSGKLAQENARYMISVFTPTTMMYTVSFRQAFLITDYLLKLHINLSNADDDFSKKLKPYVAELWKELAKELVEIRLHDNKNQHIRLLEAQHVGYFKRDKDGINRFVKYTDLEERLKPKKNVVGDSYTLVYHGSLAMMAQAQRHRTLRYTMKLDNINSKQDFYIPEIVDEAGLADEWLEDISRLAYCFPQGTMVRITEQGLFEDFALKCKERMCGRAQLEIMRATEQSINQFLDNKGNLSYENQLLLDSITIEAFDKNEDRKPCARCQFPDFKCTEGCNWGSKKALTRCI